MSSNIFTSDSSSTRGKEVTVLGGGSFMKKGSAYRNWKRRGYKIMSNGILTYYDLKTEGEKGTFNISKIKIINGPIENIWEIDSDGVPAETAVAVNVHSYDEMRTLEVVFFTRKDVKIFCGLLLQASVTHNIKEFQEEFDFKLADGEATDMSAPTLPEYCTVLEGVFLKLGHVRKGWKRRKFRIRKCTNYVGSNAKPGLLECGANLGSTSGSVVSSVILGNIVVRLDEDLCKGSTAVVVTSPESSLNVSVALDTTIQRRLKDVSVILFTDGLRAAGEEGEIVDPTVLSSSKNKKGEAGKDHQFTISPQIMHFLAALKDACVSSNIEDIIHQRQKQTETYSMSQALLVTIARFVNRDFRAPIMLSVVWFACFFWMLYNPTALFAVVYSSITTIMGMFILQRWDKIPKTTSLGLY